MFEGLAWELSAGRTGSPFNATGEREYLRIFRVRTTIAELGPIAVCTCPGLPTPYSPYQSTNGLEYDLLALMVKMDAKLESEKDWSQWLVECRYSTRMPEGGAPEGTTSTPNNPSGSQNNPEEEPPDLEWDFDVVQKASQYDLGKQPFNNSAKQPFSPPPTFEECHLTLTVTRNQRNYDPVEAAEYAFALNDDTFLGFPRNSVQCMPPKAKILFRGSLRYYRTTVKLRFRKKLSVLQPDGTYYDGWQPQILDAGMMELQKVEGRPNFNSPVPIFRNGVQVSSPVLLDGQGSAGKPNGSGVIEPVYLNFAVYKEKDFDVILNGGIGA